MIAQTSHTLQLFRIRGGGHYLDIHFFRMYTSLSSDSVAILVVWNIPVNLICWVFKIGLLFKDMRLADCSSDRRDNYGVGFFKPFLRESYCVFCMQVLRYSNNETNTATVPLEAAVSKSTSPDMGMFCYLWRPWLHPIQVGQSTLAYQLQMMRVTHWVLCRWSSLENVEKQFQIKWVERLNSFSQYYHSSCFFKICSPRIYWSKHRLQNTHSD